MRNFKHVPDFIAAVYASPEYISTLSTSTAIADHVPVDFELRGCPINKRQLLEVIGAFIDGRSPPRQPTASAWRASGAAPVCVMVAKKIPCLGPITHDGCGAICPAYGRGCYGCYGPAETVNARSLANAWTAAGASKTELHRVLRSFNANAGEFRAAAEALHEDD